MKVLPIKMPDDLYNDLKLVSKRTGVPMAKIVKKNLRTNLIKEVRNSNKKSVSAYDILDNMIKNAYKGPSYHNDKTDDELLYGGEID